jgi:putative GTP pyrophosphokinase
MATEVTKTQIDRLGERLKKGYISEADLRLLSQYRRSFSVAYRIIVQTIREKLALEPTGRAKTTMSIIEKLRRESSRLTQIQDIAGCRLIVLDIARQEETIQSLKNLFERTTLVDRRKHPSHGYRAVHVIVRSFDKLVEIQVRTVLQHFWAELSEKFSDVMRDSTIKYGGGDEFIREFLTYTSFSIAEVEALEIQLPDTPKGFHWYMVMYRKRKLLEQLSQALEVVESFGTKK